MCVAALLAKSLCSPAELQTERVLFLHEMRMDLVKIFVRGSTSVILVTTHAPRGPEGAARNDEERGVNQNDKNCYGKVPPQIRLVPPRVDLWQACRTSRHPGLHHPHRTQKHGRATNNHLSLTRAKYVAAVHCPSFLFDGFLQRTLPRIILRYSLLTLFRKLCLHTTRICSCCRRGPDTSL